MKASVTVDIDASAERVWAVMSEVESWPQWTPSVRSIRRLDPGPLRVGARSRIKQPRLPPTTWTVVELVDGQSFTWTATGPGMRASAHHRIEQTPTGSRAILSIDQEGILGRLVARFSADLTKRYLALEAAGLKRRSARIHRRGFYDRFTVIVDLLLWVLAFWVRGGRRSARLSTVVVRSGPG